MASEMVKIKPSESFNPVDLLSKDRTSPIVTSPSKMSHPRKLSLVPLASTGCTNPLPPLSPCLIHVLDESDSSKLHELFKKVDTDASGFIGLDEVRDICSKFGSNDEECHLIFNHLDKDGDGLVSFEDFTAGFNEYKMQLMSLSSPTVDCNEQLNLLNEKKNCSFINDSPVKNGPCDGESGCQPNGSAKVSISSMTSDTGIGSSDSVASEFGDVHLRIKCANDKCSSPPDLASFFNSSSDKGNKGKCNLALRSLWSVNYSFYTLSLTYKL